MRERISSTTNWCTSSSVKEDINGVGEPEARLEAFTPTLFITMDQSSILLKYTCFLLVTGVVLQNKIDLNRLAQFNTDLLSSHYMNILSQYGCGTTGTVVDSIYITNSNHSLNGQDINNILQTTD